LRREVPSAEAGRAAELVALLCGATTVITANMGMLGPLLLQLADEFEVSLAQAGLLASATALPWALAAPLLGPLSDRFGRRRTLGSSLLGLGLATLVAALAPSFGALFALRVLSGLLASAGPTSVLAAVGDQIRPARRASALGWVNAGFGLAALVGVPAIGAVGGLYNWRAAFVVMGLATVLLAGLIWWRLPGSSGRQASWRAILAAYRAILADRRFPPILLANVCERAVYATIALYLASFLIQRYALSLLEVAPLLALTALGTITGNVLGGWLADRLVQPRLYGVGQAITAGLALTALVLAPGLVGSLLLFSGFWLATSASRPAIIAMASNISSEHRGTALGIFSFTNQAGWALGPALGGLAFALSGYPALGLLCALASLAAALLILPLARQTR
jgi:predicted MFS family arabinose efflux permease